MEIDLDYKKRIDAETWAFIDETARFYPADAAELPLTEQRQFYDSMSQAFHRGYPEGVSATDSKAGDIPLRIYTPGKSPVTVIYFHGGSFVFGGLDSHDDVCAEICDRTGFRVVSVDYRLAPEYQHPAMFDDALAATKHVLTGDACPLLLCGDSAGGNLAAAVAHAMRSETDRIIGQVLIYPELGGDLTRGSYTTYADAPMLSTKDVDYYQDIRLGGPKPVADTRFAPLQDSDFSGLPPTAIFTAEFDPLSDDGRDYSEALQRAGVPVTWINETGLVHGYLRGRVMVKRAADSFQRILGTLSSLGGRYSRRGSSDFSMTSVR